MCARYFHFFVGLTFLADLEQWIFTELGPKYDLKSSNYEKVAMTPTDTKLFLETLWLQANHIQCGPKTRVSFHRAILALMVSGWRFRIILPITFADVEIGMV